MTGLDMKRRLLFLPALLALTLGAFNADDRMLKKASEAITGAAYRAHVAGTRLRRLQGREPGSDGERKTLEYIEKEYLELGLQPAAGGDFRQEVALVEITGSAQSLSFSRGAGGMTLAYGDDMVIGSRRVQPQAAIAGSEVVFVGYGIHAPETGWDDYAGIDMRGKTALILVNDPGFVTGDESLFRGKAMTYHGRWTYKFEEASRQGAAAAIIVHETLPASYDWGVVRNSWSGPQFYLDREDGNAGRTALEGWITEARARQLMELAGQDFDALKAAAVKRGFRPVPLGRHRDRGRAQRDPPQALAERRRPDAGQGPTGRVRHLHGALGPPRGRRRQRGRPHLQRRGGQCDGRRRHSHDREGVPGHAAGRVAFGAVHRRHGRGVGPARVRVLRRAPPGPAREDRGRDQHRRAQSARPRPGSRGRRLSAPRTWKTCWPPLRSRRIAR